MRMRRTLLPLLFLVLGSLTAVRARADDLDEHLAKARADAVRGLEEIAAWAVDHRLIGGRHRALWRILYLAPDHVAARGSLEFSRSKKDGVWTQSKNYREPADWNKDALPDYDRRVMGVLTTFRNDAMVAVEQAGDASGSRRDVVFDQLAALLPDDEAVHKARGDVRFGKTWAMAETARAFERRLELRALARKAFDANTPATIDPIGIAAGWASAFRSTEVASAGSVDGEACRRSADLWQAYPTFFVTVFGLELKLVDRVALYLLNTRAEAFDFFKRQGEEKAFAKFEAAGIAAAWMPRQNWFVVWNCAPDYTTQMVVRQVINVVGRRRFRNFDRGWVTEGVGRALCWNYAGFYGPPLVSLDQTQAGGERDEGAVPVPVGDWMPVARDILKTLPVQRLVMLLTMRLSAMRMRDAIIAYALAAYLIEGMPEKAAAFIDETVATDDAKAAVQKALGISVESLLSRLRRRTDEMTMPR